MNWNALFDTKTWMLVRLWLFCQFCFFYRYYFEMNLLNCKFGPIDVPSYVSRAEAPSSNATEFSKIISDIYYQHSDVYLAGSSRSIYIVPEVLVTSNAASLIYHHGVTEDANKVKNIGDGVFETRRGVKYSELGSLGALRRSDMVNIKSLISEGIDILGYDRKFSDGLIDRIIVAKVAKIFALISWPASAFSALSDIVCDSATSRLAVIISLSTLLMMTAMLIINDAITNSVAGVPGYVGYTMLNVMLLISMMTHLAYSIVERMRFKKSRKPEDTYLNHDPSNANVEEKSPSTLLNGSDKVIPQINMISSSSSAEASNQTVSRVDNRPRGFAFSSNSNSAQKLGSVSEGPQVTTLEAFSPQAGPPECSSSKYSGSEVAISPGNTLGLSKAEPVILRGSVRVPQVELERHESIQSEQFGNPTDESEFRFGNGRASTREQTPSDE